MFFEKEFLNLNILDVLKLSQGNIDSFNNGRRFNAISFRSRSDTVLKTVDEEHIVLDNYISLVPAGLDYRRISKEDELIVIHFDAPDVSSNKIEAFLPREPKKYAELFSSAYEIWEKKETGYKYKCGAKLLEIFAECYSENLTPISDSVEYLQKNFSNSTVTVGDIASKSFMSEVYFRKLFKAEFGISPKKYIIKLRMQKAVSLINTGYYSLKEVAEMCGYTDYKYFSVEFKSNVGSSPSEYAYEFH